MKGKDIMELNWLESIIFGLLSGLTEILPVSARAHGILLHKILGKEEGSALFSLLVHLAVFAAFYLSCQGQLVRILRAKRLARVPKRRRKRPLDTKSLMDSSLWKTMLVPVILAYLFYGKISSVTTGLIWISALLFLNGLILYIPQFLPGSNKDSRMLTRVEGMLMGLGGALSVFPGISGIGAAVSVGSVCGVDRTYALNMSLMMGMGIMGCQIVYDMIGVVSGGILGLTILVVLKYLGSALAAFGGAYLGIKIMRSLTSEVGISFFAYYCWGLALLTFVLNLMA